MFADYQFMKQYKFNWMALSLKIYYELKKFSENGIFSFINLLMNRKNFLFTISALRGLNLKSHSKEITN